MSRISLSKLVSESCGLPLFKVGKVGCTPQVSQLVDGDYRQLCDLVDRHVTGDFGVIPKCDEQENMNALINGDRIISTYLLHEEKVLVLTEADRSSTILMLLSEY
ncbi:hypothetical protein OCF84_21620 (plasmid) [Shewanella xiamenensis]|uniref:Uncharacterized protein n=1 Tax=Shewanella xiamenensis TaxID=332186 RepID=A0ABT6UDK3_9GAMM|nr:hypothetical protein [Shewanella xiamenensis]MDI5832522.1 hypothetical protein [Shewanella xiamenensis]WHF57859.1 hypothetical protein OCF84_21620 [Shewanella xiamenensis]